LFLLSLPSLPFLLPFVDPSQRVAPGPLRAAYDDGSMAAMLGSGELQGQMVECPDPACGFRCMRASAREVDAQVAQALRAHAKRPVRGEWLLLLLLLPLLPLRHVLLLLIFNDADVERCCYGCRMPLFCT
jgi:hypothetical protein